MARASITIWRDILDLPFTRMSQAVCNCLATCRHSGWRRVSRGRPGKRLSWGASVLSQAYAVKLGLVSHDVPALQRLSHQAGRVGKGRVALHEPEGLPPGKQVVQARQVRGTDPGLQLAHGEEVLGNAPVLQSRLLA